MTLKIERDRWYLTRGGAKVRVVCVDAPFPFPVVGVGVDGGMYHWRKHGRVYTALALETPQDIIAEVCTPREWVLGVGLHGSPFAVEGPGCEVGTRVRVREVLDE